MPRENILTVDDLINEDNQLRSTSEIQEELTEEYITKTHLKTLNENTHTK